MDCVLDEGSVIVTVMSYFLLAFLVFGISCSIRLEDFRAALRTKSAVAIALSSQLGIMPLVAYLLGKAFLEPVYAVGVLLLACAPGGSFSNILAYYGHGDMALSVSVTAVTNITSFLSLPALLYLYASEYSSQITLPILDIALALLMTLIPASLGIALKYKAPVTAKKAERAASVGGAILIVATLTVGAATQLEKAAAIPPSLWFCCIAIACTGLTWGYFAPLLLRCFPCTRGITIDLASRKTICLETGIQNSAIVSAMITLSFANDCDSLQRLLFVPWIYSILSSAIAIIIVAFWRFREWQSIRDMPVREVTEEVPRRSRAGTGAASRRGRGEEEEEGKAVSRRTTSKSLGRASASGRSRTTTGDRAATASPGATTGGSRPARTQSTKTVRRSASAPRAHRERSTTQ
jgi:BASS family bile acid:Na+ symporter